MIDRVAQLAFLDPRKDELYFCRSDCKREDREQRRDRCSDCQRAARNETVGAVAFRLWKPE